MKGRVFAAALLASTVLTPVKAHAMPPALALISGLTGGALFPVAGILGSLGAVGYSTGFAIGSFLGGSVLGRALLGVGLSAISGAFSRPGLPDYRIPEPSAQMGNFAQPVSYAQWVFGRTRKGGPLGFTQAKDSRRYYVVILAAHEIEGVVQHWLDEYTVGLDTSTTFTDANLLTGAEYTAPAALSGNGRIEVFTGASGQAANAGLVSTFTEITSDFDFAGLAGAVVWARKVAPGDFSAVYPRGRQWAYTPVIDGHNRIYDPRDETYKFTSNAALVMAFWLTEILGVGVDWDDVAAEADVCDETVLNAEGEPLARWTINGTLSDDQTYETQRAQMAGACDAFVYERTDGKVGFKVGRWIAPTVTLSASDFLDLEVTEGQWGADAPTEVSVKYIEPDSAWRESPSGTWVEDASVNAVKDEPELYLVSNHNQASRLAKRIAKARRPKYQLSGTIGLMGYELIGQRFFTLTHAGMGITQFFEVGTLVRASSGIFELTAVSVGPADFDFDASTEEPDRPEFEAIDSAFESEQLTGFAATAGDGGSIVTEWDAQEDYLWQQVRWKAAAATQWQSQTITDGATELIITGLLDGTTYQVQGRNAYAGLLSNPSDWTPEPAAEVTTVGSSVPPSALTAFSTTLAGSDVTLDFTTANDGAHFATRLYRGTTTDFGGATLIHTDYSGPNSTASYDDESLAPGTYYFWAVPVNASGVAGTESGPETETIV
ncbi:hypothetical protein [Sagittula sp. MA-2]|jgi:hypothetical protein|uniref:hypothetical protein n=1 Tax=Sagittula sp. MA-2 TaxID=3048007 RepID=UPI0024C22DB8|nr:hypothetical protein [Sagittula sp. MA-2]WHZ35764.1 hypothetical protein QNI11_01875 [Sagittula sp. MA-2]